MKISNESPTSHILIALMDYRVDHESSPESKYGFGYFKMDSRIVQNLNRFHDNWEKGKRNFPGVIIHIPELILFDEKFIFNQTEGDNPNLDGMKLDSINFLESQPTFDYKNMVKGVGEILAYRTEFIIQGQDLVERGISLTIYRSALTSYWRINHLLQRKRPI